MDFWANITIFAHMFRVFITENNLKQIITSESQKPELSRSYLYKIIKAVKKPYVFSETKDAKWVNELKTYHGIMPDFSKSDYIKNISAHPETTLLNPSSLFVLDISIIEAQKIQTSYGVMCLCSQNLNAGRLLDTNDEHTTDEGEEFGLGWGTVLKSIKALPSNSLILTDRYFFSAEYPPHGNGIINIHNILDALLPQKFLGVYDVTIVFDPDKINKKYIGFNEVVTKINKVKQLIDRDYPINMEILGITEDCDIYEELHNRRIVSNYYIVKAEHKLAAFNKNIATCLQTITPQVLFTVDSLNGNSTPPLKAIDHVISTIREFSDEVHRLSDHTIYSYALNGKCLNTCTGVINRLLK